MTERTRLISSLLYGRFSVILKKNTEKTPEVIFLHPLGRARGHSRSCSLNRNEPGDAIKTTRHSFFDKEIVFVFITPRSRANLLITQKSRRAEKNVHNARSLGENLACSAANQRALTIVAI